MLKVDISFSFEKLQELLTGKECHMSFLHHGAGEYGDIIPASLSIY
jgi:hypothetical protein